MYWTMSTEKCRCQHAYFFQAVSEGALNLLPKGMSHLEAHRSQFKTIHVPRCYRGKFIVLKEWQIVQLRICLCIWLMILLYEGGGSQPFPEDISWLKYTFFQGKTLNFFKLSRKKSPYWEVLLYTIWEKIQDKNPSIKITV